MTKPLLITLAISCPAGDAVEVKDYVTREQALIPLAGPANRQGRIAADNIAGRSSTFRGSQGTSVLGLFDMTLAATGASEKTLKRIDCPYKKVRGVAVPQETNT
jgi:NADPH-dependent 2,4-dienoyl-CoA reductase/sulfur reductase-like enzyme